jgi:hypothetical protein
MTECGCLVHAWRKFFELLEADKSQIAAAALEYFGKLYKVEAKQEDLDAEARRQVRQAQAKPIADALHK